MRIFLLTINRFCRIMLFVRIATQSGIIKDIRVFKPCIIYTACRRSETRRLAVPRHITCRLCITHCRSEMPLPLSTVSSAPVNSSLLLQIHPARISDSVMLWSSSGWLRKLTTPFFFPFIGHKFYLQTRIFFQSLFRHFGADKSQKEAPKNQSESSID